MTGGHCLGGLLASVLAGVLLATPAAAAPPGASMTATAHALDELANCRAQRRPECPTETVTPTFTARPTLTPIPAPTATTAPAPTSTPVPPPNDPPLPVPEAGQAIAAYVRPTPRDPSGTWLELAAPAGRWAVLYDTSLCSAPAAWTNVWLALDEQSQRPITVDRDGDGMCAVSQWSWSSDVPCAADEDTACDVEMDGAYWDALSQAEPTPTDTPLPVPISTPTTAVEIGPPTPRLEPVATPISRTTATIQVQPPPAAAPPPVVSVEDTPQLQIQDSTEATAAPTPTAAQAQTPSATPTTAPSDTPTVPVVAVVVGAQATIESPTPTVTADTVGTAVAAPDPAPMPSQSVDLTLYLVVGVVALIVGAFFVLVGTRRLRPW
jgi:hypothetical protein